VGIVNRVVSSISGGGRRRGGAAGGTGSPGPKSGGGVGRLVNKATRKGRRL